MAATKPTQASSLSSTAPAAPSTHSPSPATAMGSEPALLSWVWLTHAESSSQAPTPTPTLRTWKVDLLAPLRNWLNTIDVQQPQRAHRICQLIPAQCPFERDVKVLGRTIAHIPPLCKLNPLYDEVVALRFRALCYLADECGEDISSYC